MTYVLLLLGQRLVVTMFAIKIMTFLELFGRLGCCETFLHDPPTMSLLIVCRLNFRLVCQFRMCSLS